MLRGARANLGFKFYGLNLGFKPSIYYKVLKIVQDSDYPMSACYIHHWLQVNLQQHQMIFHIKCYMVM